MRKRMETLIEEFVESDRGNRLPGSCDRIFDSPLVGVVRAEDPIFCRLREEGVIGPHHRSPKDWLPGAKTVISYFLPIDAEINRSNYEVGAHSERWMYARFYGELFNERLRRRVAAFFHQEGYEARAPSLMREFASRDLSSNWSERHVAYAAGLGSFGLHAGLITERGVCGRFGSVVTSAELESSPAPRTDEDRRTRNCLWFTGGDCSACVQRCPVGALHPDGKDKARCRRHLREEGSPALDQFGFPYSPCGKCYVDVPCERRAPTQ